MTKRKKKSDNINGNYPLIGWRLKAKSAKTVMEEFEKVERAWNASRDDVESGYKRNYLFYKALMIGLAEMKKNPPK